MNISLEARVDEGDVIRLLHGGRDAIARLVDELAAETAVAAAAESAGASRRVAGSWHVAPGDAPDERRVAVGNEAWFAHFLARGTRPHGPRRAERLHFQIDGTWISAQRVAGVRGDPFHERAMRIVLGRRDSIMARLIAEATR